MPLRYFIDVHVEYIFRHEYRVPSTEHTHIHTFVHNYIESYYTKLHLFATEHIFAQPFRSKLIQFSWILIRTSTLRSDSKLADSKRPEQVASNFSYLLICNMRYKVSQETHKRTSYIFILSFCFLFPFFLLFPFDQISPNLVIIKS